MLLVVVFVLVPLRTASVSTLFPATRFASSCSRREVMAALRRCACLVATVECSSQALGRSSSCARSAEPLPGRWLVASAYVRDASLASQASAGPIGQRRGAARCSWDDICTWMSSNVGQDGRAPSIIDRLHSPAIDDPYSAEGGSLFFGFKTLMLRARQRTLYKGRRAEKSETRS